MYSVKYFILVRLLSWNCIMAQQYIFQIYVILSEVENMQKKSKIKKKNMLLI